MPLLCKGSGWALGGVRKVIRTEGCSGFLRMFLNCTCGLLAQIINTEGKWETDSRQSAFTRMRALYPWG